MHFRNHYKICYVLQNASVTKFVTLSELSELSRQQHFLWWRIYGLHGKVGKGIYSIGQPGPIGKPKG